MAEIFNPISKNKIGTRNGFLKLNQPSKKKNKDKIAYHILVPQFGISFKTILKNLRA